MDRLRQIGFQKIGRWSLQDDRLVLHLDDSTGGRGAMYRFTVDNEQKYIGKTVQTLRTRMAGCLRPDTTQATNVRNQASILNALRTGRTLKIFALSDPGLMRYGEFHLNVAAGLEDSLIASLRPEWNSGRGTEKREAKPSLVVSVPHSQPKPHPAINILPNESPPVDIARALKERVGKSYTTRGAGNAFMLESVDPSHITVRPSSSGQARRIPMKQIVGAFLDLVQNGTISLRDIRNRCEMNPVYFAAVFTDLPGITPLNRPIRLQTRKTDQ